MDTTSATGSSEGPAMYFADIDGYCVGDRLLEGVMFRVELAESGDTFKVVSVAPHADDMAYLANISWRGFADTIKERVEADLDYLFEYATGEGTTVKELFDEHARETGLNGGDVLNES